MKTFVLIALFGALGVGGAAMAEAPERVPTDVQTADQAARTQVRDALEQEATLPAQAPTLPDSASQNARDVHATLAFGQKGAAERTAHAQAQAARDAQDAASRARADAANRAAQGAAASEARNANADSHDAAGQDRQNQAHSSHGNPGAGNGNDKAPLHTLR